MADEVRSLREWVQLREMSTRDFADVLGIKSRGSAAHYLAGRREPGIKLAIKVARALGIRVEQVAEWQPEEPQSASQ